MKYRPSTNIWPGNFNASTFGAWQRQISCVVTGWIHILTKFILHQRPGPGWLLTKSTWPKNPWTLNKFCHNMVSSSNGNPILFLCALCRCCNLVETNSDGSQKYGEFVVCGILCPLQIGIWANSFGGSGWQCRSNSSHTPLINTPKFPQISRIQRLFHCHLA